MCEELKVAREELAAETDRRIDALEQLRHAERLATIGRLAAGVAHELGTPLNVIMGRAKLIRVGDPTGAARTDNAAVIEEQSRRIKTTIDQLLGFARRRQAHPTPTDLRAVVRHAASLLEPLTGKAQVRIDLTLGEPSSCGSTRA